MYPSRLRHFMYGCAMAALDQDTKIAGGSTARRAVRAMGG
jgi:hypothetical protein